MSGDVADLLQESLAAHQRGDSRRAAAGYLEVLAREPTNADALHLLGVVMKGGGCLREAARLIRKALEQQPDFVDALYNLGNTCLAMGDLAEAARAFEGAVEAGPNHLPSWLALALVRRRTGALEQALVAARAAVKLAPAQPELRLALAELLLLSGAWTAGFRHYEARLRLPGAGLRPQPRNLQPWDGRPLRGRLIVAAEPAAGDILMFSRFLAPLRDRVGGLTLMCPDKFVPLFRAQPDLEEVLADDEEWPWAEAWTPLASLPRLLGDALGLPFAGAPPLLPPAEAVERWAPAIPAGGARVGLVWAGEPPRFPGEPPLTLQHFLALPMPAGLRYFSLQTGPRAAELAALGLTGTIVELGPHLFDYGELAAALAHLDLVITCDSAVAHLAGAMGRPAWLVLAAAPDWRWGHQGGTSPWYPSVRLFRQERREDWGGLLERVGQDALTRFAGCAPAPHPE
jgi:tetratricopeptide (TPR) repeat protein